MAMLIKNKNMAFSLIFMCLFVVYPMANAQFSGLLGGATVVNIQGLVTCFTNGSVSTNTTSIPPFADVMFTWIKLKIESGRDCRFWTDNWYPEGKICELMTGGRRTRLGIRQDATIASLYDNGHWLLPPARSENQVSILAFLSGLTISTADDFYVWEIDRIYAGQNVTTTTTGANGVFSFPSSTVFPISLLSTLLNSGCRAIVTAPLSTCNASLPTNGLLRAPLNLAGTIVTGGINILQFVNGLFRLI
ncbi:hypothetical protein HID58_053922 [Brassica napus]|uniref:Carboxypeptidase regulatory-like domain-containing protein n=1 Tax=Brassica napus TaxID=3708 RepID=A0ABQ8AGG4_BRANA|nr:hypothetical protein HID58_053922 [Brassica napus]